MTNGEKQAVLLFLKKTQRPTSLKVAAMARVEGENFIY